MRSRLLMVFVMVIAVAGLGCSKAEVKDNAHKAGDAVEDAAHTTADADGYEDAKEAVEDGAEDAAKKVKGDH